MSWVSDFFQKVEEVVQNIGTNVEKGFQDTGKELERAVENVNQAAVATGHFLENQAQGLGNAFKEAERRVEEGKIVDAIWHLQLSPATITDDSLGKAVMESSLLNNIATATASVYGGPQGAAAYAAWYTYKQTKDLMLALKAGIIAGATKQGLSIVDQMPSGEIDELTKKALASASIGGAAVAASGGDGRAIAEAFVKGAVMTAAREHYKSRTESNIEGKIPTKDALPKLDPKVIQRFSILKDENGNPILNADGGIQIDIRSMPKDISHVGIASALKDSTNPFEETSSAMQMIAKVPYINDMAYYHDQWMAVAKMSGLAVQATIVPALILTVAGSDLPIINQATQENIRVGSNDDGDVYLAVKSGESEIIHILDKDMVRLMTENLMKDPTLVLNSENPIASHIFIEKDLGAIDERLTVLRLSPQSAVKIEAYTSENNYIQPWVIYAWRAYDFQAAGLYVTNIPQFHEHSNSAQWEIKYDGTLEVFKTKYDTARILRVTHVELLRGESVFLYLPV